MALTLVLASLLAGSLSVQPAVAFGGVVVVPRPLAHEALSYFKLQLGPGHSERAGAIELHNPGATPLQVTLAPVDGETLSTLGSGYAPPGSHRHRAALWVHLGQEVVTLAPRESISVPVSVTVPATARAGDYLAGVSVQALAQHDASRLRNGLAIASVERYAIGVEIGVPGARRALIRFAGASLARDPAGLTFLLHALNPGNVILQGVSGSALITRDGHVVAHQPLGPGTFVTATTIAYPILTPHEFPPQGTIYRVRAYLRYAGGIARLDTLVRFGRAAALSQQAYGGPTAPSVSGGHSAWVQIAVAALAAALGLLALGALLRRRRADLRPPLRTLEALAAASSASGEPLNLIALTPPAGVSVQRTLTRALRSRLRRADRLCSLGAGRLLVIAPDTDTATAQALALDLRRQLERAGGAHNGARAEVYSRTEGLDGAALLALVQAGSDGERVPTASG